MYGYISGFTDANNITYCPKCGAEITDFYSDGTAWCRECDFRFGVVECEERKACNVRGSRRGGKRCCVTCCHYRTRRCANGDSRNVG